MPFVIAVIVDGKVFCSHCDHCGDGTVVTAVCVQVSVFVETVVGVLAVKSVVAFDGVVVTVFILAVVMVVVGVVTIAGALQLRVLWPLTVSRSLCLEWLLLSSLWFSVVLQPLRVL